MATLYGNPENFRVQKVLIAAKLANKNVKTVPKEPPAKNFPLGLAPAFEDGNVHLFGAEAIAKYLLGPDSQYLPENPELDQWIYWAEGSLLPNVLSYVLPSVFAAKVDQKNVEQAKRELLAQLQQLNNVLVQKDFLVSDCLSMADVSVAVNLLPAYQHVLDTEARKQIGNVNRWFQTVLRNPDVKSVVGELKFINEPSKLDDKDNKIADAVPNDGKKEAAAGADDFDLFGSDEEQEDEEKKKVTEARLKAYAEKKSKKPGPIAKSNVIYDIKPWDDTIDIKEIESNVRTIASDGLVWGTSKVLPVAFGINKLQICCCVEDDKVSTDWLEEQITSFEDLVQSVDVVAFNKV